MVKHNYTITAANVIEFEKIENLIKTLPHEIVDNIEHAYKQSGLLNYIEFKTEYTDVVTVLIPRCLQRMLDEGIKIYFDCKEETDKAGVYNEYTLIYKRHKPDQRINIIIFK